MRPLIVLLIVLLAVGGLVFTLMPGGDDGNVDPAGPAASGPSSTERPTGSADIRAVSDAGGTRTGQDLDEPLVDPTRPPEIENPTADNRLLGTVVNQQRQPVAGATVRLSREPMMGEAISLSFLTGRTSTGKYISTVSDSKGNFAFDKIEPAQDYYLAADHDDYCQVQEELVFVGDAGEFRAPTLVLTPGSTLSGFVKDIQNNVIADAVLHLDSAYMMGLDTASPDRMTVRSDVTGYYEFKNVGRGPRNLTATAEGYAMQMKHNITFQGTPGEQKEWEFRLEPGNPIGGQVLDPKPRRQAIGRRPPRCTMLSRWIRRPETWPALCSMG